MYLKREFIKVNKKTNKKTKTHQERDQEKEKVFSFFLVAFLVERVFSFFFPCFLDRFLGRDFVFCFPTFLFSVINSHLSSNIIFQGFVEVPTYSSPEEKHLSSLQVKQVLR